MQPNQKQLFTEQQLKQLQQLRDEADALILFHNLFKTEVDEILSNIIVSAIDRDSGNDGDGKDDLGSRQGPNREIGNANG
jgi:hypothetical protein